MAQLTTAVKTLPAPLSIAETTLAYDHTAAWEGISRVLHVDMTCKDLGVTGAHLECSCKACRQERWRESRPDASFENLAAPLCAACDKCADASPVVYLHFYCI